MQLVGEPRVAVLLPARDFVDTFFMYDYSRMLVRTAHTRPRLKLYPMISTGASLSRQRETLADSTIGETDATHLLWLDSDMRFPADTLLRLLAHNKPAVCASYIQRGGEFKPQAYTDPFDWEKRVWVKEDSKGLLPIVACGFGCVLMERWVIEKVERPRFLMPWIDVLRDNGQHDTGYMQEDLFFFLKMRDAGIELLLDQDLTKEVAHIGRFEFLSEHGERAAKQRGEPTETSPTVPMPGAETEQTFQQIVGSIGGPTSN